MADKRGREYWKELKPGQKVAYFWYYYKWFVIIFGGLAVALIALAKYMYRTPTDYMAEVVLVNANSDAADDTDYFDDFISAYGYEEGYDYLYVDSSMTMDVDGSDESAASTYQILAAMFLTGEIDVFVSDEDVFEMQAENNGFYDLTELLSDEMLEEYGDDLYYYENEETGETVLCGIYLNDSPLCTEEGIYEEVPIAGIGSQSAITDIDIDILSYFLGEENP